MRIAYLLSSLGIGGAERQVIAVAERMASRGHKVILLVLRPPAEEQWRTSVTVVHLDMEKTPLSILKGFRRARLVLRDFRPDILHSHTYPANMIARMLRLGGAAPAVVSSIHSINEGGWQRMLAYRLTDPLCRHTTAVSEAAANRCIRLRAVPQKKCTVVANGFDTAEFEPSIARRIKTRSYLGVSNQFVWLAAGRAVPAKDFPNLLRAFAQVCSAFPKAELWIAGDTFGVDRGGGKDLLGAFAMPRGTMDHVRWLGLRRDMPALLDGADGFVLSSAWEGMPLVVGEAMAMEKPVVATDVGGVHELLDYSGAIVPPHDAAALAAGMLSVMHTPLHQLQANGRAERLRIQAHFNIDSKVDEWEALYTSLSNEPAHPPR